VSSNERHQGALPTLYGASGAPKRRANVAHNPRPFDPDDLPLECQQTDEERDLLEGLPSSAHAAGGGTMLNGASGASPGSGPGADGNGSRVRALRWREIAGRFLGGDGSPTN
jgi:hypothetical protein